MVFCCRYYYAAGSGCFQVLAGTGSLHHSVSESVGSIMSSVTSLVTSRQWATNYSLNRSNSLWCFFFDWWLMMSDDNAWVMKCEAGNTRKYFWKFKWSDRGLNPGPLDWQSNALPLDHLSTPDSEVTVLTRFSSNLVKMFVFIKSRSSLNMSHEHSRGHSFYPILTRPCQNVCLYKI